MPEAMPDELKKSTLYSLTLAVCAAVILSAIFVSWKRERDRMTEAEKIAAIKASRGEQVRAARRGAPEFSRELLDPSFAVVFERVSRERQGPISYCTDRWPGAPASALLRITTDAAGALSTLAVQGAPAAVEDCLIGVLSKQDFPWDVDAVVTLHIDRSGASIEEIGGVTEPAPDLSERPKAPEKVSLPGSPGAFTTYQGP